MLRHRHLPSPAAAASPSPSPAANKKRGNYNCGRCGAPKKGHVCSFPHSSATPPSPSPSSVRSKAAAAAPGLRRCALFLDAPDLVSREDEAEVEGEDEVEEEGVGLAERWLYEVMRRLEPRDLMTAGRVCKGWRGVSGKVWKSVECLSLRVPRGARIGFVGSVLSKCCGGLVRLGLRMESDVDSTMLACIAFSCPNLESMEITTSLTAANRITGDELARFVADKRCLSSLKMEGCSNLGGFTLTSSSLSTLWLSGLHSLSRAVLNCPHLREISLEFSRQENDSTDLTVLVDYMGRSCPRLQNIHIASVRMSHAAVLALAASNFRSLKMLSLVLGSEITDASMAALASSYSKLELLDLSGSSISDSGIGMICNVFPETLTRLLLALCPNITSSGIQFATAQLPRLELMDCGMTICDSHVRNLGSGEGPESNNRIGSSQPLIYQKLIIKHSRLRKLSLWGCSGLDALSLNCPELNDLNITSCKNLHPDQLLIQCPKLDQIHASGCQELLISALQGQVNSDFSSMESYFPVRLSADGSKRVRVPHLICEHELDHTTKGSAQKRQCIVLVDG
ncbi:hypothetical protein MLD38_028071 [Melastoma candidum]|uniref:Uncharacterized protein n=1 Tax=Melastoma candidum TaxID=119954 RepID=A0ACB9N188_9MYRT|nr:hypothetical protein MLD38_028071 [Melastoma candidum]